MYRHNSLHGTAKAAGGSFCNRKGFASNVCGDLTWHAHFQTKGGSIRRFCKWHVAFLLHDCFCTSAWASQSAFRGGEPSSRLRQPWWSTRT
eukprot:scaffold649_cov347-Pavlova_lutheri.AAC.59